MNLEKIKRMTEVNTLYLLLTKEHGLDISLDQFVDLCNRAKEATEEAVKQILN